MAQKVSAAKKASPRKAPKESPAEARARMGRILKRLKRSYPYAECALHHENAFQLVAATILSAQCTDARVNMVTPALFERFPDARAMAKADLGDLEELIRSTGFYKNKALALKGMSQALVERHGGEVPRTLDELVQLRGVGRKTANVVLGNAFGIPGLVVDTHVTRICGRLGYVQTTDAVKIERIMMEIVPREDWTLFAHLLITHGREVCIARKPRCSVCPIAADCPRMGVKQFD